jgi:taurine dioxygenase
MTETQFTNISSEQRGSHTRGLGFRRYTPNLGAIVTGTDLRRLNDETRRSLKRGLYEHGVLFFRDQELSPTQLLDVASIFGEPLRHNPYIPSTGETSGVEIIEQSEQVRLPNDVWHSDVTWQHNPPRATLLYGVELPTQGGDTAWTSTTAAYRSLPPLLAAYLDTLQAVNAPRASGLVRQPERPDDRQTSEEIRVKFPPIDVDVIRTHPDTGEKYIFVTEGNTLYIKGVSRAVSESILRILSSTLENHEFQARFTWEPRSLAVWDNRLTQHRAIHDYGAQRRVLHRITIA